MFNAGKSIQNKSGATNTQVTKSNSNIEIHREGTPIEGTVATGHVYLLIDKSASMTGDKISQAKRGALKFAKEALSKGYYTGLIQFDSSSKLLCEPFKDISAIEKAISRIETGDNTHMGKAINLANNLLKGKFGMRVMVIITDGMPNGEGDPVDSLRAGDEAKKAGIDIIVIGTDDADQAFLKRLASRSELGVKVDSKKLEQTITDSARMLPVGDKRISKK
jgi:Mg-chelatase subunit ChlD